MFRFFNPMKALKIGLSCLALAGCFLLSTTTHAQYVRANGNQIVDESGQPLFFNGTNLGNWLLWEGYLMMGENGYLTHSQFLNKLTAAIGSKTKAKEFERQWRLNYVTRETIDELVGLGYNSVRVPFHYDMFYNKETKQLTDDGFKYIDDLIEYCRDKKMYILLDMHAAPGYQNPGDHSDNQYAMGRTDEWGKAEDRKTVGFWEGTVNGAIGENVKIASQVWRHIALRYRYQPIIWGYDLINEPVTKEGEGNRLMPSFKAMRDAIREVDPNHVIVLEGDWWGSYMKVFDGPMIDNNIVLQTHHYVHGAQADISLLHERADLANKLNVPIILGEFGEDNLDYLRQIADIARDRYDGSFAWSFKKVSMDKTLWRINPTTAYQNVVRAIKYNTRVSDSDYQGALHFAQNNIRNKSSGLDWFQDFYEKTTNPITVSTPCVRSAYKNVALPGVIQAEDFDNGCVNQVYADSSTENAGGAYRVTNVDIASTTDIGTSGYYVGWTTAGEWLDYTVDIPQAGNYTFTYRVASPYSGGSITMNVVGVAGINLITAVPQTGGWESWRDAVSSSVNLPEGKQTIRLTLSGGFNVNSTSVTANSISISGTYVIKSKATNKVLDIRLDELGINKLNGAKIQQWSYENIDNQKWKIERVGEAYKIISVHSGKALDVVNNNKENYATLQQWDFLNGDNQKWKLNYDQASGTFSIISVATNKAVDVPKGNTENGQLLQMYDFYPGNINQQWMLNKLQ